MTKTCKTFTKKNGFKYLRLFSAAIMLSILCNSVVLSQYTMRPGTVKDITVTDAVGAGNGISVNTAKVYDDSALQLMLNAARLRLASLQSIDQTGLLSRIGAVTGASLQQQAFSAQIMGPSLPEMSISSLGGTNTTKTVTNATGGSVENTVAQPVENVTTKTGQQNPVIPPQPSGSTALPTSGFGISSLDALSEMMQLTYEIANLQLLLEGSLSDRYVAGERLIKPRTTLGFPITITTPERYKEAVAIVEIEVANSGSDADRFSNEPPTVTALLPREKTYNVASITDKMTSIGGGMVSQVINGGFSYLRGRKSYYIVQDQDTLAMMYGTSPTNSTVFSWQFRPVLGQRYVRSGLKQTFVQLAAPLKAAAGCFGNLRIKTYWRKYDRKRGVLKEVIPESIRVQDKFVPIPKYDLTPVPESVEYKDLGSGVVQASVIGKFLPGTYVRVGSNLYREGSPGFASDLTGIRFIANAAEVARHRAYLVSRDGSETEIVNAFAPNILPRINTQCTQSGSPNANPAAARTIDAMSVPATVRAEVPNISVETIAYDNANSILNVAFEKTPEIPAIDEYIILVGGKVYGLSDAPIERTTENGKSYLRVVVPNNLLANAVSIEVKPLFWREDLSKKVANPYLKAESSTEKVTIFGQKGGKTVYLLYGNRLGNAEILFPEDVRLMEVKDFITPTANGPDRNGLRAFVLTEQQVKTTKQIVIRKSENERPIFVAVPAAADADKKPVLTVRGGIPVPVGVREIIVLGDMEKLKEITLNGATVDFTRSKDNKFVTLSGAGLSDNFTDKELVFEFQEGVKTTLKLEFANNKNKTSIDLPK